MAARVRRARRTAARRWVGSRLPLPILARTLLVTLVVAGLATACTESPPPGGTAGSSGSELPDAVKQLPVTFYQGTSAEPGATFDLAKVRSVTTDPLQSVVIQSLEEIAAQKSPQAFYRYQDIQVLGGSCSGQGDNRVCEIRVQRVFDTSDAGGQSQGARNDTRIFRAKPVGKEWKLFDTQLETPEGIRWITDLASAGSTGSGRPASPASPVSPVSPGGSGGSPSPGG